MPPSNHNLFDIMRKKLYEKYVGWLCLVAPAHELKFEPFSTPTNIDEEFATGEICKVDLFGVVILMHDGKGGSEFLVPHRFIENISADNGSTHVVILIRSNNLEQFVVPK